MVVSVGPFEEFDGDDHCDGDASCPRRALVLRSVLRRSCPKLDSHELVRSMVQRIPSGTALGVRRAAAAWAFGRSHDVVDAVAAACLKHRVAAVAAV